MIRDSNLGKEYVASWGTQRVTISFSEKKKKDWSETSDRGRGMNKVSYGGVKVAQGKWEG